jgi:hypothetical protein
MGSRQYGVRTTRYGPLRRLLWPKKRHFSAHAQIPIPGGGAAARAASNRTARTRSELSTAHRPEQIADLGIHDTAQFVGTAASAAAGNAVAHPESPVSEGSEGLGPLCPDLFTVQQSALKLTCLQLAEPGQGLLFRKAGLADGGTTCRHETILP